MDGGTEAREPGRGGIGLASEGGIGLSRGSRFAIGACALAFVGLIVRIDQYLLTHLVFTDTAHYIDMARMILDGNLEGALGHEYHPLFALVIAGASHLAPDRVTAAMLSAVVAGALAVVPLGYAMRRVGGDAVGLLATAAYAVSPYPVRYAAAGNSEALYFLCFFTAVAFGLRALARLDALSPLLCAFASGCAYLVRPEGAGVFVAVFGMLVLIAIARMRRDDASGLRPVLACLAAFALAVIPYLWLEYRSTGTVEITAKKSLAKMLGFLETDEKDTGLIDREPVGGPLEAAGMVVSNLASSMAYPLAALAVVGFVMRRRRPRSELHLLAIFLAYSAVLFLLVLGYGYVSRRHAAPVSSLALGWSAVGFLAIGGAVAGMLSGRLSRKLARRAAFVVLGTALVVGLLLKGLQPAWKDQVAIRKAGEWLAELRREQPDLRVVTPYKWADPRIPVYAGLPIEQPTVHTPEELFAYLEGARSDYLAVIDVQLERKCPDPERVRDDPRLELVHVQPYEQRDRAIEIYRVTAGE